MDNAKLAQAGSQVPSSHATDHVAEDGQAPQKSIGKCSTATSYAEIVACRTPAELEAYQLDATTKKDIERVQERCSGELPPAWEHRVSIPKPERDYRRGSVLAASVMRNGAPQQQRFVRCAQKQQEMGFVDSRTVAEMLSVRGVNPYAVDQMSHDIIRRFRIKSLALVAMQNIASFIIAFVVERVVTPPKVRTEEAVVHNYKVALLWVATIAMLIVTSCVRHRYPFNYICSVIFTLLVGSAIGCLTGPCAELAYKSSEKLDAPQLYVLGFYIVGILVFALMAILSPQRTAELREGRREKRTDKVPLICLALLSAVITCTALVIFWSIHRFMPATWLAFIIVGTTLPLLWVGYAFNRLCSRLNPDEYFYPMILIWVDLFIVIITLIICMMMFCGGGGDSGGGMESGGGGEGFSSATDSAPDTGVDGGGDMGSGGGDVAAQGGDGGGAPIYAAGGDFDLVENDTTAGQDVPGIQSTRIQL